LFSFPCAIFPEIGAEEKLIEPRQRALTGPQSAGNDICDNWSATAIPRHGICLPVHHGMFGGIML
jgi:hypothetical protein